MSENEAIVLEFDYTLEDYREACIAQQQSLLPQRSWAGWIGWLLFLPLLLTLYFLAFKARSMPPLAALPATAPAIVAPQESLAELLLRLFLPVLPWLFVIFLFVLALRRGAAGPPRQRPAELFVKAKRPPFQLMLGTFAVIIGMMILVKLMSPSRPQAGGLSSVLSSLWPWLLIFVVIWLFVFRRLRGMATQRMWTGQPLLHLHKRMTIDDAGVSVDDVVSRHNTKWEAYPRFIETPNLFLLMLGDYMFHMVPKRAVGGPEAIDRLRERLRQKIQNRVFAFPVLPVVPLAQSTPSADNSP